MGDPISSWAILFRCPSCRAEMMQFYAEPADVDSALSVETSCAACRGPLRASVVYEQLTIQYEVGTPARWAHEKPTG